MCSPTRPMRWPGWMRAVRCGAHDARRSRAPRAGLTHASRGQFLRVAARDAARAGRRPRHGRRLRRLRRLLHVVVLHQGASARNGRVAPHSAPNICAPAPDDPGTPIAHGLRLPGHCPMFATGGCSYLPAPARDLPHLRLPHFHRGRHERGRDASPSSTSASRAGDSNTPADRIASEHRAVTAAANFLRQHPVRFPGGSIPSRPSEIAVLAVKSYAVFLQIPTTDAETPPPSSMRCREFDRAAEHRRLNRNPPPLIVAAMRRISLIAVVAAFWSKSRSTWSFPSCSWSSLRSIDRAGDVRQSMEQGA